ncbi:MAG: YkgJ family cysteine cluster protein [Bacillota bacterium]|nr:YkgJ family cysteine cluster protein [Bacillota bacterium]
MSAPDRVRVDMVRIDGANGYDLFVADPEATVGDYLAALNRAIEELPLDRGRARRRECKGCDRCCAERLPLTAVDARVLRRATGAPTLSAFLALYGHVLVDGRAVDITLARREDGRCCFLDCGTRTCRLYTARPLVCQTFICSPQTKRARRLREVLVNKGEDELVRQWLGEPGATGREPLIHEGYSPRVRAADWPATPFAGCEGYDEILLREVCPPGIWRELTTEMAAGEPSPVR